MKIPADMAAAIAAFDGEVKRLPERAAFGANEKELKRFRQAIGELIGGAGMGPRGARRSRTARPASFAEFETKLVDAVDYRRGRP